MKWTQFTVFVSFLSDVKKECCSGATTSLPPHLPSVCLWLASNLLATTAQLKAFPHSCGCHVVCISNNFIKLNEFTAAQWSPHFINFLCRAWSWLLHVELVLLMMLWWKHIKWCTVSLCNAICTNLFATGRSKEMIACVNIKQCFLESQIPDISFAFEMSLVFREKAIFFIFWL